MTPARSLNNPVRSLRFHTTGTCSMSGRVCGHILVLLHGCKLTRSPDQKCCSFVLCVYKTSVYSLPVFRCARMGVCLYIVGSKWDVHGREAKKYPDCDQIWVFFVGGARKMVRAVLQGLCLLFLLMACMKCSVDQSGWVLSKITCLCNSAPCVCMFAESVSLALQYLSWQLNL